MMSNSENYYENFGQSDFLFGKLPIFTSAIGEILENVLAAQSSCKVKWHYGAKAGSNKEIDSKINTAIKKYSVFIFTIFQRKIQDSISKELQTVVILYSYLFYSYFDLNYFHI